MEIVLAGCSVCNVLIELSCSLSGDPTELGVDTGVSEAASRFKGILN